MQATTMVVGWSVIGALTAQLVQPLPSASLLKAISPTIATAANNVFNTVNMGLPAFGGVQAKPAGSRAR
jgi:hypothetical protein